MLTIQGIIRNQHQQQQRRLLRLRQHCKHSNNNNNNSSSIVQLSYFCCSNTSTNDTDDNDVVCSHKNNQIYSSKNSIEYRVRRSQLSRNSTSQYYQYSTSSIQNSSNTGSNTSSDGNDNNTTTQDQTQKTIKKEDNILHSTKKLSYDEIFAYDLEEDEIDDSGPIIPGQYYLDNERKDIQNNIKDEQYNYQLNDLYTNVLRNPNTLDPTNNKLTRYNMIQHYNKVKQQLYNEHTTNNSIKNKLQIEFSKKSSRYFYNDYDKSESNPNIGLDYDQIPDWNTTFISQLANDRIVLYNANNNTTASTSEEAEQDNDTTSSLFSKIPERYEHLIHVPTLQSLVNNNDVPISIQNNVSNNTNPDSSISPDILYKTKLYTLWRKRQQYNIILNLIKPLVYNEYKTMIVQQLDNWDDKQDAIDLLYETIEQQIYDKEIILNKHPLFHKWCVQAIEESLTLIRQYQKKELSSSMENNNNTNNNNTVVTGTYEEVMNVQSDPVPIFMDCYDPLIDNSKGSGNKGHKTKNDLIGLVAPTVPKKKVQSYAVTDRITIPVPIDNGNYNKIVPSILHPLSPTPNTNHVLYAGSMIEEWDLAANKNTKRIMIRNCTKHVASLLYSSLNKQSIALQESSNNNESSTSNNNNTTTPTTRIVVAGRQGVGKTATIASIVASARKSGCIVLYFPEADRLRKIGYYVEPNEKINEQYEIKIIKEIIDSNNDDYDDDYDDDNDDETNTNSKKKVKLTEEERTGTYDHNYAEHILYDVPILAQETCMDLLYSHSNDFEQFIVSDEHLSQYFYEYQVNRIKEDTNNNTGTTKTNITLKDLLTVGAQKVYYASQCYSIAMDILVKQTQQPFIIVIDEYNVFYDPEGFYYHTSYDPTTQKSIPYEQISLFKPLLHIMSLTTETLYDDEPLKKPKLNINYGAIIVSTTESHAVPRKITDTLLANATTISTLVMNSSKNNNNNNNDINDKISSDIGPIPIVTVPKLSNMEVEYMVANYESIGVGMLRIDRGQTLSNQQEIQYLKAVAGNGIAQKLFNACIVPLGNFTLNKV